MLDERCPGMLTLSARLLGICIRCDRRLTADEAMRSREIVFRQFKPARDEQRTLQCEGFVQVGHVPTVGGRPSTSTQNNDGNV